MNQERMSVRNRVLVALAAALVMCMVLASAAAWLEHSSPANSGMPPIQKLANLVYLVPIAMAIVVFAEAGALVLKWSSVNSTFGVLCVGATGGLVGVLGDMRLRPRFFESEVLTIVSVVLAALCVRYSMRGQNA